MITPEKVAELLSRMAIASALEDGVRISTHVLYPSNGAVSVVIRGGENSFVISDEGGGVAELGAAGLHAILSDRMIATQIRTKGMRVYNGVIMSPMVPLDAIPAAIMLVANASRTIAEWGLTHFPFIVPRNFREDLATLLGRQFHDNLKKEQRNDQ